MNSKQLLGFVGSVIIMLAPSLAGAAWTTAPTILRTSDAVMPGKLFSVSGGGLNSNTLAIAVAVDAGPSIPAVPPPSAVLVPVVQSSSNGIFAVAQLPLNMGHAIYNVWAQNEHGWSQPIRMNAPRPLYMSEYEAAKGLDIKLVGRNMDPSEFQAPFLTAIRLNNGAGGTYTISPKALDPFSVTFTIGNEPVGTYWVEISNDGGLNWIRLTNGQQLTIVPELTPEEDPLKLGVAWARGFNWTNVYNIKTDPRLGLHAVGDGITDDTTALNAAVDIAWQAGGGMVFLPTGQYLTDAISFPENVVVVGEHRTNTVLLSKASGYGFFYPGRNSASIGHQGVARLTINIASGVTTLPDFFFILGTYNMSDGRTRTAREVFISEVTIDYPLTPIPEWGSGQRGGAYLIGLNERFLCNNNFFYGAGVGRSDVPMNRYCSHTNNVWEYSTGYPVFYGDYTFIENSRITGHPEVDEDSHGFFGRANVFMAGNDVRSVGSMSQNDGEGLCSEQAGNANFNYGTVISSSDTSLVVNAHNTLVEPTAYYGHVTVVLVDGTGIGQQRRVSSVNTNTGTIYLEEPWTIEPDSSTKFTLLLLNENLTFYNNSLSNCTKGIYLFGNEFDTVAADNTCVDTEGIYAWGLYQQPAAVVPNYFIRIDRNTIRGVSRKSHHGGIAYSAERFDGVGHYYAIQNYGMEIRGNTIVGDRSEVPVFNTECPQQSGIACYASLNCWYDNLNVPGDAMHTIIEDNTLRSLNYGVTLTHCLYGQVVSGNNYDSSVGQFSQEYNGPSQDSRNTVWLNNASSATSPTTVSFRYDYGPGGFTGVDDTWIWENYPNNNKGESDILWVGSWIGGAGTTRERTLIRFRLDSLQGRYSSITGARLKLKIRDVSAGTPWTAQPFNLHAVTATNKGWAPGLSEDLPSEGGACWNYLAYSSVTDLGGNPTHVPWAGSVGLNTPGTDYLLVPAASVRLSGVAAPGSVVTFTITNMAMIEAWINSPADNSGLLLTAPDLEAQRDQAIRFFSSQSTELEDRPVLELDLVGYRTPPGFPISYTLANPGQVSLVIYDNQGKVVRELLHAKPQAAGAQSVVWNGLNELGQPAPDGTYSWKLLQTPNGLTAEYILNLGVGPQPDYINETWPANHQGPRGIALHGSDVIVSGGMGEGPPLMVKISTNGTHIWSSGRWIDAWQGGQVIAVDGDDLYMLQQNSKVGVFNATSGNYTDKLLDLAYNEFDRTNATPDIFPDNDMAAKAGALVISYPTHNAFRWINPANGATISEASVPSPQGIALDAAGNAYVVSGTTVLKFANGATTGTTLINSGLVAPYHLTIDPGNNDVLVIDRGSSQQVKRFSSGGAFKAAYGKAGGRYINGLYDNTGFRNLKSIVVAQDGTFWVTEPDNAPRRVAHFSADGNLLKEFYGGQLYANYACADPDDPTLVWMDSQFNELIQARVDYATKTWSVLATYSLTNNPLAGTYYFGGGHWLVKKRNGNTYLCRDNFPVVALVDEANRNLKMLSICDRVSSMPAGLRPADGSLNSYAWVDADGDGQPSVGEFTFSTYGVGDQGQLGHNSHVDDDFAYYGAFHSGYAATQGPGKMAPSGWNGVGAPVYNWSNLTFSITEGRPPDAESFHCPEVAGYWRDSASNYYGAYNIEWGPGATNQFGVGFWSPRCAGNKVQKWNSSGQRMWTVGKHAPLAAAAAGEGKYYWAVVGMTHGCIVVSDVENSYFHVYDTDGLWVGRLLDKHPAGLPDVAYKQCGENFGGSLYTYPSDEVLLFGNSDNSSPVYKITGWDGWVRFSGTVSVTYETGLKGEYYNNMDLTDLVLTRTDETVDFAWGDGSPDAAIDMDSFSVRWTGQILPEHSETYTFHTTTDDGVRLWVNGQLLIDHWIDQGPTVYSGTLALTTGRWYAVTMEYYENGGGASASLSWSSPSQPEEIIPGSWMLPGINLATAAHGTPIAWLISKGFTNNFDLAEEDDQDSDTSQTWQEFVAGTDPTNIASLFHIVSISEDGSTITWYGTTNNGVTTGFRMRRCTNLVGNAWEQVATDIPRSGTGLNEWSDPSPPSNTPAFYRPIAAR